MQQLQEYDIHLVFDDTANRCKVFNAAGRECWRFEMRNNAVHNGTFGHWGNCPRGDYKLGTPERRDTPAFGHYFTPLIDLPGCMAMAKAGRAAIGIHGGGSDRPDPLAPDQGWENTLGCLRCLNEDNDRLVELNIHLCHMAGGTVYLTVTGEN